MPAHFDLVQFLLGAGAAVTILAVLFGAANKWMLTRIGLQIAMQLDIFRVSLAKDYVSRPEYELMEKHGKETHDRHEREFDKVWNEMAKRPRHS